MIALHRLRGEEIMINPDLIESMSSDPDTVLVLTTGNHVVVKESMPEIRQRIIEFKKEVFTFVVHTGQ